MASLKKTRRKTIRVWTVQDIKQLREMARQKIRTKTIARKLRRTLQAVYVKASEKRIRFKK